MKKGAIETRFVDRPELSETFADSFQSITFDGQTLRIEFCTTRLDKPKLSEPPTGRKYPVCRLVLTPTAAIALFNKLQQVMSALEQSGAVQKQSVPPQTIQ